MPTARPSRTPSQGNCEFYVDSERALALVKRMDIKRQKAAVRSVLLYQVKIMTRILDYSQAPFVMSENPNDKYKMPQLPLPKKLIVMRIEMLKQYFRHLTTKNLHVKEDIKIVQRLLSINMPAFVGILAFLTEVGLTLVGFLCPSNLCSYAGLYREYKGLGFCILHLKQLLDTKVDAEFIMLSEEFPSLLIPVPCKAYMTGKFLEVSCSKIHQYIESRVAEDYLFSDEQFDNRVKEYLSVHSKVVRNWSQLGGICDMYEQYDLFYATLIANEALWLLSGFTDEFLIYFFSSDERDMDIVMQFQYSLYPDIPEGSVSKVIKVDYFTAFIYLSSLFIMKMDLLAKVLVTEKVSDFMGKSYGLSESLFKEYLDSSFLLSRHLSHPLTFIKRATESDYKDILTTYLSFKQFLPAELQVPPQGMVFTGASSDAKMFQTD
ncbi:uncharacterized protein RJT20DRAFT_132704 [Scheffersomyces xylosifermentans]|uniref:uncharacterized protein n=1 Tax=Scheffersomyces xylosifermentans TaxID=1304137 RepID=UPI00315C6C68